MDEIEQSQLKKEIKELMTLCSIQAQYVECDFYGLTAATLQFKHSALKVIIRISPNLG